jgi:hypothetical protein
MTFEHKISTRHPKYWILAVITTFLGVPIAFVCGIVMISGDGDRGALMPFLIGLMFSAFGLFYIYRIIFPKEFTRIISNEMIVCKMDENITHQFNKKDINMIFIQDGETESVHISLKNNEELKFPPKYYMDLTTFRKELMMNEYPVYEPIIKDNLINSV